MSQLKTNAIRHISATSDAITLASDGGLTDISGGQLGNRNKVYNGAMQIAQRSTSAITISDGSNEGYQTVDRWDHLFAGGMGGSITSQQVTDAPEGFRNSLKLTCASTGTTLDSTQHLQIRQKLEGQDIVDFAYGDSSAKKTTISWYMKAVNPKIMCANVMTTLSSGRYWTKKFTPTTSWARYSMVVDGDTSNATDETSSHGYSVQFSLAIGSGKRQASDSTSWTSTANLGVDGMENFLDSTSNELYITGVQVEVGNLTPYEHRSYRDELLRCARYYQQIGGHSQFPGRGAGNTEMTFTVPLIVPLRASPTVSKTNSYYRGYDPSNAGNSTNTPTVMTWNAYHNYLSLLLTGFTSSTGVEDDKCATLQQWNDGVTKLDAEL